MVLLGFFEVQSGTLDSVDAGEAEDAEDEASVLGVSCISAGFPELLGAALVEVSGSAGCVLFGSGVVLVDELVGELLAGDVKVDVGVEVVDP